MLQKLSKQNAWCGNPISAALSAEVGFTFFGVTLSLKLIVSCFSCFTFRFVLFFRVLELSAYQKFHKPEKCFVLVDRCK